MPKNYHPSADCDFVVKCIEDSGKIIPGSKDQVGNAISFVKDGTAKFHRRFIVFRHEDNQIPFHQAMALAADFGFIHKLMEWYEVNREWKEGEYVESRNPPPEE